MWWAELGGSKAVLGTTGKMYQVHPGDKLQHTAKRSIQERRYPKHRSEVHSGGRARDSAGVSTFVM